MRNIIIIGGAGNGTVICSTIEDAIEDIPDYRIHGFLADDKPQGETIGGYDVIGKVGDAIKFNNTDTFFVYALTTVKVAQERYDKLLSLRIPLLRFATFKHPTAVIGRRVDLGYGIVLMPNVVVSPDVSIGNHTQLYANSFVGHDSKIGEFCFIANNASVGGKVSVGRGVHIGSNCTIRERITIGDWAIIGMGAVVLEDVEPHTTVVGNPAKVLRKGL